ncbi:amino acid synthesis family protein [Paraburkholderia sp. MMS20-SJTN17]|uniref:Amino acid synthesis family protein n=1 Tax=Paraburkholderia translucens TaxID=2886945 RepID=A0ABS8K7Y1_9BURK|nr:amino acid synthesis family protein [Paraburkholderia sp. MMS20-SJTN17]MCC8400845.1 amino acid synthesis family protein [Paraburkholderia sp. MMS20-SJTN17]
MAIRLRNLAVQVDETRIEMGEAVEPPARRAVAIAAIDNPYAGRYEAKPDAPLRAAVGKGAAMVPSEKKIGTLGTAIDVPLGHKDAADVRSHFDAIKTRVADEPRASEIVVAVAVTASGRPLPRIGGLQASEIKGEDGLR